MTAAIDALARQATVPIRHEPDGGLLLVPGDEAGLARALGAMLAAGLPPRLDGPSERGGVRVSLAGFARVIGLQADDGVLVVEPGATYAAVEAALSDTAFECPVFPACSADATVYELAAQSIATRAFHPFGARAEWVRDLRLVTPAGHVVRSPVAPRRSTGPELRLPALALGPAWGVPTRLSVRVIPRAPRDERGAPVSSPVAAFDLLERLGGLSDEASFLAEATLGPASARVRVVWRQTGLREPPDDLWQVLTPGASEPVAPGPVATVRVPWGEASRAWLAGLRPSRARKAPLHGVRLWGPDRQGLFVELVGPPSVADAARAGLLPAGLAAKIAPLAALCARLGACNALDRTAVETPVATSTPTVQPVRSTTDRLPGSLPGGGPPDPQTKPGGAA
jgi:FAD/FMN-containing dehydrogenase